MTFDLLGLSDLGLVGLGAVECEGRGDRRIKDRVNHKGTGWQGSAWVSHLVRG